MALQFLPGLFNLAPAATPLPPLRQDLGLFEASPEADGTPAWSLHDPAANRFYRVGWAAFEVLSRWHLGTVEAVAEALGKETTLALTAEDVQGVILFLERHHLLEASSAEDSARLLGVRKTQKLHWAKWLLKNYLFFRLPLVRPDPLLAKLAPRLSWLFHPAFWAMVGVALVFALFLVMRQWDAFTHTFSAYHDWEAALAFAAALSFSKVAHELGHAVAARHHGCRVPSMGVAFLVMWPVLYTDTTEAWKLPSRRARLQIAAAGMTTELLLAMGATYLWFLLPEGSLRAAVFFLATTTWVLTLAINASPFMRFDGYFLLSDLVGIPNLHSRAFALGRWWLREKLFALGAPVPEHQPPRLHRFLIGFAFATWIYRLTLFVSIALLVYYLFFKALGIFLMLVEIGWFVLRPLVDELQAWRQLRSGITWNKTTKRSAIGAGLFVCWLLLPWQGEIAAPALLSPAQEQTLYAPMAAQVVDVPQRPDRTVHAGDVLVQLSAPDLESRLAVAQQQEATLRWQVEQQALSERLMQQGDALRSHWQEAQAQLNGLLEEQAKLTVRAPFDGAVLARNDDLQPGSWVANKEMLFAVADRRATKIEAYVEEDDLDRLSPGHSARFVPDAPEFGRYACEISEVDRVNLTEIDEPSLASNYGGPVATRVDNRNGQAILQPVASTYRIRLDHCSPTLAPTLRVRGVVHLDAKGRSLLAHGLSRALRTIWREAGL